MRLATTRIEILLCDKVTAITFSCAGPLSLQ